MTQQVLEIVQAARERKQELQQLLVKAQKELHDDIPKGKLRISHSNGCVQYYQILDSTDTRGRYIRKQEKGLAKQLAQKDYLEQEYREDGVWLHVNCHSQDRDKYAILVSE